MGAKPKKQTEPKRASFTPGPWNVEPLREERTYRMIYSGSLDVAQVGCRQGIPVEELDANARLIAAAPDLLLACRDALSALNYLLENEQAGHRLDTASGLPVPIDGCMCARCTLARAIAKAEGKEVAP